MRRAAGIACLLLGAVALTPPAYAAVPAAQVISVDPFAGSAQHVTAVEPDNLAWGNTVVAVFQVGRFTGGGATGIGWATSTDGGLSWRSGVLPGLTLDGSPPGPYSAVSDPAVAYDRVHGVWLASVLALFRDARGEFVSELVTSRSGDGITWSAPVVTAANEGQFAHDKNWIVCDTGAVSPFAGRCYTLWADALRGSTLGVAVSTDGGLTWGRPLAVDAVHGSGWQPLVRPDGVLVVPYIGGNAIRAVRSTDGGASFGTSVVVASIEASDPPGVRAAPLPSAEVDGAGRVYVAWSDCRFRAGCSGDETVTPNELVLSSSADGVRWTAPVRVPPGASGAGIHHLVPGLGVDTTTRGTAARLALAYYTLGPVGCTPATCLLQPWAVASPDAGRSWSAPVALAGATALANLARSDRGRFVGDYISTAFVTGGVAVPVFSTAFAPFDGSLHQGVLATAVPPLAPLPAVPLLGRATASPARPRAGRRFAVSTAVTGAVPAAVVACSLRVGGKAVALLARRLGGGRARCEWRIPAGAAGRRAAGSVAVTSGGRTVRRTFSYVVVGAGRA